MVFGFPDRIRHSASNTPFIRTGSISSQLGSTLEDKITDPETGQERLRTVRGFLIDGTTVPGQSGGPVVLAPIVNPDAEGGSGYGTQPMTLVGVIAETTFATVRSGQWDIEGFAGFGLAYDAETIIETINEFPFDDAKSIVI